MDGDDTNASLELPSSFPIPLMVGQRWWLTGDSTYPGGIYEIMGFRNDEEDNIAVLHWTCPDASGWCYQGAMPDGSPQTVGAGSQYSIPGADFLVSRRLCFIGLDSHVAKGRIRAHLDCERHRVPTRLPARMEQVLELPNLRAWLEDAVKVWTDGSWKRTGTLRDRLDRNTHILAGSAMVKLSASGRYSAIRMVYDKYTPPEAYVTELLALTAASRYGSAPIYSDCASAIATAQKAQKHTWRSSPLSPVLEAISCLEAHKFVKVQAHPERTKQCAEWSAEDRGIYLADCVADPDPAKHLEAARLAHEWSGQPLRCGTMPVDDLLEACAGASTFVVRSNEHDTLLISDPIRLEAALVLAKYVAERDTARMLGGRSEKWTQMSTALAEAAWLVKVRKQKMTIARRAAILRSLWDKYMFGDKRQLYGEAVHSKCRRCNAPESHAHILVHCEDSQNRLYRMEMRNRAKQINDRIQRDRQSTVAFKRVVRALKAMHDEEMFCGNELRWTGMLSRFDIDRLGDAVLDTPMTDSEFQQLAGLQRAYSAGALALTQGYIHSQPPVLTARSPQDIRNFFPSAPRVPHSSSSTSTPRGGEWIQASNTFPAHEPAHTRLPIATSNRFSELDSSDNDSEDTSTSLISGAWAPTGMPKRRKRDQVEAASLFQMVTAAVAPTLIPTPDVAYAVMGASKRQQKRSRPSHERSTLTKRRRYHIIDSDSESMMVKPTSTRTPRGARRLRAQNAALTNFEKRLALTAGLSAVTRRRLINTGVLRDTRGINSYTADEPTGIG